MSSSTSADPSVSRQQCLRAATALKQAVTAQNSVQNPNKLFDVDTETVTVQFGLSEIPHKEQHKPQRIKLPHPFWPGSEVCVFVKDDLEDRGKKGYLKKRKLWKNLVKREVAKNPASLGAVKKVICVEKLKKEFKQFEAKRQLAHSYDLFLCDKSIIEIMPRELGK